MFHNYLFSNVNEALPVLMKALLEEGDDFDSRAGMTTELMHVGITLEQPWKRELVLPDRKASVAAQVVETMWVLSGRNDVAGLVHYLPRAADFSDDGERWRAGYGPRLREYQGTVDQLDYVVGVLADNPGSRQAVVSLWDPTVDTTPGKDIACLAGETPLLSPEGDLPIEQVAAKFDSGEVERWPVYAVDPDTRKQRITWASNVWQSGVKPTIRLKFDDGSDLRLTHDHRLYIKRRVSSGKQYGSTWEVSEIEAGDLRPGDRVLATRRFSGAVGHEQYKKCLDENTAFDNLQYTHQAYAELLWGPTPEGYDVHHLNEIKTDNRAENLQVLSHGEHASLNMFGDDNPMRRMEAEKRAAKGRAHSVALTGRKHSEETKQKMREATLRRYGKQPDNHVVVAVEDGGTVPVYDFTVPGEHTALVGTGVVAHNCNNWLSFSARDGELDLHVGIRSNDAMWGWSGINAFEWSALQEVVAGLTQLQVGSLHFSVTSFHLYERHWDKAAKIAQSDVSAMRLADSPRFDGHEAWSVTLFDELCDLWFEIEHEIRHGNPVATARVEEFPEPMLRSWLRVLQWFWSGDLDYLNPIQGTQLHEACLVSVAPPGKPQPEQLQMDAGVFPFPRPNLLTFINDLHAEKHEAYGDSWKRRGELGILSNIARKVDRINNGGDTRDEGQLDTAIDLLVYLAKMRVWLEGGDGNPREVEELLDSVAPSDEPATFDEDLDKLFDIDPLGTADDKLPLVDRMLGQSLHYAQSLWS